MLLLLVVLQFLVILLLAAVLLRKPAAATPPDARMLALPDAIIALEAKFGASDSSLRTHLSELRRDNAHAATEAREAAERSSRELREEVNGSIAGLSKTLHDGLHSFRGDHASTAKELRETLDLRLNTMGRDQRTDAEQLRDRVHTGLQAINRDNTAKLEEMRQTVDEKLHATLQTRLTESFGQVSDQLTRVHTGLGEMKELANGVSDLKKVFSNVKSRGIVGEFQLGMQLEQMFSREQYEVNVAIKRNSGERVEFALKIPDGDRNHVLLPIDAKFPREDWERLEHAYEHGTPDEQAKAGAAFERGIRTEGKRICEKYIDPPTTLPFAIMFLPTEALYAEVMRRPALHTDLQSSCNVTIAGPSSFMAILTSFQMGFRTLAIQKKGNEVWNVLGSVKKEFGNFELLMNKVENNVKTVQNTLNDIGVRTRAINKKLHNVSELSAPEETVHSGLLSFNGTNGVAPLLAAMSDDE